MVTEINLNLPLPLPTMNPKLADRAATELSAADALGQTQVKSGPGAHPSATAIRVLLVEDDLLNRKIVNRMLAKGGYEPVDAQDGAHALALMAQQSFDVVLMDWQMPVMDGLECTRRMRLGEGGPRGLTVPIIALTANAFSEDRVACVAAGMNDFLSKPVQAKLLHATVAQWAERWAALRAEQGTAKGETQAAPNQSAKVPNAPPMTYPPADADASADTAPAKPLAYDPSVLPALLGTETPNAELERQVIGEFVRSWRASMDAIESAIAHCDTPTLRRQMHTLKSTSATIGAMEIADITAAQDARLSSGQSVVEPLVALLTASFERFETALATHQMTSNCAAD